MIVNIEALYDFPFDKAETLDEWELFLSRFMKLSLSSNLHHLITVSSMAPICGFIHVKNRFLVF